MDGNEYAEFEREQIEKADAVVAVVHNEGHTGVLFRGRFDVVKLADMASSAFAACLTSSMKFARAHGTELDAASWMTRVVEVAKRRSGSEVAGFTEIHDLDEEQGGR